MLQKYQKYIDGQYRRPTGMIGRWIGSKMAHQHSPENLWTVSRLDVQPTNHILEIGFGPGFAIQALTAQIATGHIAGVDFSRAMVAAASRRNAAAIKAGRVTLKFGMASDLPFEDGAFDKAFSIHSLYFWPEPMAAFQEIWRVLKPDGLVVITVLPKEKWSGSATESEPGTLECRPYSGEEIIVMMRQAGFGRTRIESDPDTRVPSNFSVIGIK
jgi:SAM-dependent methyltransferase